MGLFAAGDPMQMSLHSLRHMTRPALRLAVVLLLLVFTIVSGANAEVPAAPGHFASQSVLAANPHDCPNAEPISGNAHCHIVTLGIPGVTVTLLPSSPATGSSVWPYGAAMSGPITIGLRLFRPPRRLRALV